MADVAQITAARESLCGLRESAAPFTKYEEAQAAVIIEALDYAEKLNEEVDRWKSAYDIAHKQATENGVAAAEWQETCEDSQKYAHAIIAELKAENQRLKYSEQYTTGDCDEKYTQLGRATSQLDIYKTSLEEARDIIRPFADAARSFTVSIAPDGIDDGLTVGARIAVMPGYEATLSTSHFSRAADWMKSTS
jgi:hypothetical protein